MQNKPFRFGPVALSATLTTNILNPPTLTGGVGASQAGANTRIILTHIRVVNKTGTAATFSLYLGATGANVAGTELSGTAKSVAANDAFDWYGRLPVEVADFLVGGAGTATALTIEGEGEIGVA
jgi:hypothetical protein